MSRANYRPPFPYAPVNVVSKLFFFGGGGASQNSASQILSFRVYNIPMVSTISRPCLLAADSVYKLQTIMPRLHQHPVCLVCTPPPPPAPRAHQTPPPRPRVTRRADPAELRGKRTWRQPHYIIHHKLGGWNNLGNCSGSTSWGIKPCRNVVQKTQPGSCQCYGPTIPLQPPLPQSKKNWQASKCKQEEKPLTHLNTPLRMHVHAHTTRTPTGACTHRHTHTHTSTHMHVR